MKTRVHAKIGTHSSTILVLWNNKPYKVGDWIFAMKAELYDSLHSKWKNIKSNGMWKEYYITETNPILFVTK